MVASAPTEPLRPSPDALLSVANQERRGKLKIFLGAAPGVGKTYEMLTAGRKKLRDGVDVLIGVVETHGRKETLALTEGYEIAPRRREEYKGGTLEEMDLDAILRRHPQLVLVDELAHTNAPGSRHPKRHQDVTELLAAGIDVYSTLNIQHVESLNDVVAQITHVRVRETVPDSIVDEADDIELVDITPDGLLERMREGKVYQGEGAQRAQDNYFTPSNLTALRELALRRTAERVDQQLRHQRQARGVQDVWAASERVLVCVNEAPSSPQLVRHAKRVADRLAAPWTAVYLETERSRHLSEAQRDAVAQTLRLAERLGADTLTLPGGNIADELLRIAREQNVTQIVTGKSRRSKWFEWLHGSVVRELLDKAGNITIQVIAEPGDAAPAAGPKARPARYCGKPGEYLATTIWIALATALGVAVDRAVGTNVSMVYLPVVLLCATRYGLAPSLYAALAGSLCYNYFLLEPLYSFSISDPDNVLAFCAFVIVALLISQLTARARAQTLSAREQAATMAALLNFGRRLAGTRKLDQLYQFAALEVAQLLKVECVVLAPAGEELKLQAAVPATARLEDADMAAATWCWRKSQPTGWGSDTLPGARRLYVPLAGGTTTLGVIGVSRDPGAPQLQAQERRLLDAIADLSVIALDRILLARDVDQSKMLAQTEKLRSALLTSISHDLRTPLASILGAVSSLRSYGRKYDEQQREELLATAQEETERMSRFVANLLDMTRLDSGALEPKLEACDLNDIAGAALRRVEKLMARHDVRTQIPASLPMLRLDFVLLEQVLVNLLDNAAKYSAPGTAIEVVASEHRYAITLEIRDRGPGIPAADLQRVFDPFFRVRQGDQQRAGTGLGLAVCRGFVQAMGGAIRAENRDGGGCVFTLEFPASLMLREAVVVTAA